MSIARSVAEVLREHVVLEVEAIDRMYLNVCVPHLQSAGPLPFALDRPWPSDQSRTFGHPQNFSGRRKSEPRSIQHAHCGWRGRKRTGAQG
jgi:hypothetical protein